MMKRRTRTICLIAAGLVVVGVTALLSLRTDSLSQSEWTRVSFSPLCAVRTAEGRVLLLPVSPIGTSPEEIARKEVLELGAGNETAPAANVARRNVSAADGSAVALVYVGPGGRVAGVPWSAGGPRNWSFPPDSSRVALTDASERRLYVYDAGADSLAEWPVGDPESYLGLLPDSHPEGWACRWVYQPRWSLADDCLVFSSNRYDTDFTGGLSLWLARPGAEPERLWAVGDIHAGGHLEYLGASPAGHLVFEVKTRSIYVADKLGGALSPIKADVSPVSLSPNARWLVLQPSGSGALEPSLLVLDLGSAELQAWPVPMRDLVYNSGVSWNPSGSRLAFFAYSPTNLAVPAQVAVVEFSAESGPKTALCGQPGSIDPSCPLSWVDDNGLATVDASGSTWVIDVSSYLEGSGN